MHSFVIEVVIIGWLFPHIFVYVYVQLYVAIQQLFYFKSIVLYH